MGRLVVPNLQVSKWDKDATITVTNRIIRFWLSGVSSPLRRFVLYPG